MDRPQDKRRMTISYIVAAIILVIVVILSQVYTNYRVQQRRAAAGETEDTATVQEEEQAAEEDKAYEQLTVESSIYDGYRYRSVTDAEELAALGLPASVSEEDLGGKFATADNQIVLYAYPRYGCRAVLIGNNTDKYSFCVLDGFTDNTKVGTLAQIPPLYGIRDVPHISKGIVTDHDGNTFELNADSLSQLMDCLADCVNNNAGTSVPSGITITLTAQSGLPMELTCDQNLSIVSVLGESYKISTELKTLLQGLMA